MSPATRGAQQHTKARRRRYRTAHERLVIQLELPLERAIGHAAPALEHGYRLVENLLKGHRPPSLCRCGMQKTVWEWGKPFGRMYTAYG